MSDTPILFCHGRFQPSSAFLRRWFPWFKPHRCGGGHSLTPAEAWTYSDAAHSEGEQG